MVCSFICFDIIYFALLNATIWRGGIISHAGNYLPPKLNAQVAAPYIFIGLT